MDYDDGNTASTTARICTYLNLLPLWRSAQLAHRNSDGGLQHASALAAYLRYIRELAILCYQNVQNLEVVV